MPIKTTAEAHFFDIINSVLDLPNIEEGSDWGHAGHLNSTAACPPSNLALSLGYVPNISKKTNGPIFNALCTESMIIALSTGRMLTPRNGQPLALSMCNSPCWADDHKNLSDSICSIEQYRIKVDLPEVANVETARGAVAPTRDFVKWASPWTPGSSFVNKIQWLAGQRMR